jgi:glycosyltransferase involved in cell wall biosynthesis
LSARWKDALIRNSWLNEGRFAMSRVDVVIPCYKYGCYLPGCVASVLDQTGVEVRTLVIDDCSPDNSAEVAAELARRDSRVEFRRHEVNKGHIATYNEGLLDWASGDYVLLLSADDLLTPGALRRAARVLDNHPEVVLTHGRQIVFDAEPPILKRTLPEEDFSCQIRTGPECIESFCECGSNPVATPTAIARTAVQRAVGGYRKELPHTADMEMWLRFAAHGSVALIDADQAFKRAHQRNMQLQYVTVPLVDARHRREAFEAFFDHVRGSIPDSERLRELATLRIAEESFWAASKAFDRGDDKGCQACLDYARGLCPALAERCAWSRLRWKRRLGPRVWGLLRSFLDRLPSRRHLLHS